jgi:hypothetical protein
VTTAGALRRGTSASERALHCLFHRASHLRNVHSYPHHSLIQSPFRVRYALRAPFYPFPHRSHTQIKLTPLEANRVKVALSAWRENYARSPSDFDLISAWARDDIGLVRLVPLPVWFTLLSVVVA